VLQDDLNLLVPIACANLVLVSKQVIGLICYFDVDGMAGLICRPFSVSRYW
jgi:hypothetical protein